MIKREMSYNLLSRFKNRSVCPICKQKIEEYDDVQAVGYPNGRYKMYTFFHTQCLISFEYGVRRA